MSLDEQAYRTSDGKVVGAPVLNFDHFAPADVTPEQYYEKWALRRNECPVSYSEEHGGFYFITQNEDVRKGLTDVATFSSRDGAGLPSQPIKLYPEDLDPPEHRKYRQVIGPFFSPQKVALLEPWVREVVRKLLDDLEGKKEYDFIDEFARPLPQQVTLRLLGVPDEDLPDVAHWIEFLTVNERNNEEAAAAGASLFGYIDAFLTRRATEPRADDVVSALLEGTVDGNPLTKAEMTAFVSLVLFGGLETTTGALGGFTAWLADHPDERARLISDMTLLPTAIDDAIRFTTPSQHLGRTATRDIEVHGCVIPEGSRVLMGVGSANHDPTQFENPDTIVLDRSPNLHMGFGMGPHRCIGSHLAKLQLQVALEEFLARYPNFSVGDRSRIRYLGGEARGMVNLPIVIE